MRDLYRLPQKTDTIHRVPTKWLFFIGIIVLTIFNFVMNTEAQNLELAREAYENGNYSAAIDLYEIALLEGDVSGEIYFNLGNAYYLNGQPGKALQNYRRAEMYLPRNQAIAEQIALIRAERVDGVLTEADWLVMSHNITAEYLTLTETGVIAFVVWVLFFVVLGLRIRKGGWLITLSVLTVVMLIAVGLLSTRIYVETQRPAAVVITEMSQAMTGPGDGYFELFALYEGIDLRVLDERDGWLRFALPDGRQGWIRTSSVGYIPTDLG